MIVIMMDATHISERLASMKQEMSDIRAVNARDWVKSQHTALDKSAHALREGRLLGIRQELSVMMKRCA
jgi:tRNA G37 N-methylase TrmD